MQALMPSARKKAEPPPVCGSSSAANKRPPLRQGAEKYTGMILAVGVSCDK
ncbi:hypothetical protein [Selenomonas sp. AB3002]|uniref:hypothetical protein n=1 Tax=Selenomonas sp. AB3002 TaxID=1392502 RepID=UPI00163A41C5